jgi:hypothetical protein
MLGMERADDFLVRDMPLTSSLTPTGHTHENVPSARSVHSGHVPAWSGPAIYARAKSTLCPATAITRPSRPG